MVLSRALPFVLIACATAPNLSSVATQQSIALALIIDGPEPNQAAQRVASADELAEKLHSKNGALKVVSSKGLDDVRSQTERLNRLRQKAETRWVTLVEVNPRYLNPSAGRYRWEVAVQVSVADQKSGEVIASSNWNLAAHLTRSNQDALDALHAVVDEIAERLTIVLRQVADSPKPARAQAKAAPRLFYLALVDRFDDADPSNNHGVEREDPQGWHGGDLAGVIKRLPHLTALGVTDLWLTPIFASRSDKFHGHGAFHGYWTHDLDKVDDRFGGLSAAQLLRQATQRAGLKLHLDLVTNHVAWDAPLRTQHPDWFHADQAISDPDDQAERETGWVHGLPDLAQEKPAVRDYLIGQAKAWQRRLKPDGFRLDALTHVPTEFVNALRRGLGDEIDLLGEMYDGRAHVLAERWRQSGLKHVFDFPTHFALLESICGDQPLEALAATMALDRLYDRPANLLTFVDNHDRPRLLSQCKGDQTLAHLALSVLFALRGTPVITYGTESGLQGKAEPENRADMVFNKEHPTFRHLQRLMLERAQYPLLANGQSQILNVDGDQLELLRYHQGQALIAVVNRSAKDRPLRIAQIPPGTRLLRASHEVQVLAHSLSLHPLEIIETSAFNQWLSSSRAKRLVRIVTPPTQGQIVAVGSAPELGSWAPDQALAFKRQGDVLVATVELPAAGVVGVKLARREAGKITWSSQPNRYFVPSRIKGDLELQW